MPTSISATSASLKLNVPEDIEDQRIIADKIGKVFPSIKDELINALQLLSDKSGYYSNCQEIGLLGKKWLF